jgi:hypothetical protein
MATLGDGHLANPFEARQLLAVLSRLIHRTQEIAS